jgi:hypothetical protein
LPRPQLVRSLVALHDEHVCAVLLERAVVKRCLLREDVQGARSRCSGASDKAHAVVSTYAVCNNFVFTGQRRAVLAQAAPDRRAV